MAGKWPVVTGLFSHLQVPEVCNFNFCNFVFFSFPSTLWSRSLVAMGGLSLQVCVVLAAAPVVAAADDTGEIVAIVGVIFLACLLVIGAVGCGYYRAQKRDSPAGRRAGSGGAVGRLRPGSGSGIGDYSWAARDKVARPGKGPAINSRPPGESSW